MKIWATSEHNDSRLESLLFLQCVRGQDMSSEITSRPSLSCEEKEVTLENLIYILCPYFTLLKQRRSGVLNKLTLDLISRWHYYYELLLDLYTSYQPRKWIHIPPHSHLPILLSHVILSLDRMNNSWWRLNQIVLTNNFFVKLCVRHLKRFQNWILMLISHKHWFIMILERHTVVDVGIKAENLNWLVFLDSGHPDHQLGLCLHN